MEKDNKNKIMTAQEALMIFCVLKITRVAT